MPNFREIFFLIFWSILWIFLIVSRKTSQGGELCGDVRGAHGCTGGQAPVSSHLAPLEGVWLSRGEAGGLSGPDQQI